MAKFKNVVVASRVVNAGRKRKCYHAPKHKILKGETCLEVRDGRAWKGYCRPCANEMFARAAALLSQLQQAVSDGRPFPEEDEAESVEAAAKKAGK